MEIKKVILILLVLTLLGGVLRFYKLTTNPVSLNIDEVAYGYDAYSILKTGRDEYGTFIPLAFKSVGDYKNPVLIYSLVPAIKLFGLNEFSVRVTTALAGTLSIPAFFLLLWELFKKKKMAFIGAALLAISPWEIYYSRFASDHMMATFFLIVGMWLFIRMLNHGKNAFWAGFFLLLSMYTYHSHRLFIPLFVVGVLALNYKNMPKAKRTLTIFLATCVILSLPLIYVTLFGGGSVRAGMVFISQDIEYTRYVILDHLQRGNYLLFNQEIWLLFFFWVQRYLNYFQPNFWFFNGLSMTLPGTIGLGVVYLFNLPWLVWGVVEAVKNRLPSHQVLIIWVLLGLIPASLTNNAHDAGRTLLVAPAVLGLAAIGIMASFDWWATLKGKLKWLLALSYSVFIGLILVHAFLVFAVHFPFERGEAFMEGTKQSVEYILAHKDQYKEIVYDPYRGIEGPNIVNIPHMYILFYSAYTPDRYQQDVKAFTPDYAHFDNFTFRRIDWGKDGKQKGVLFIGSPWSLPLNELKSSQILEKIYLTNGNLGLVVATP